MKPRELWDREPVSLAEALRYVLVTGLAVLVRFGVPLTVEQVTDLLMFGGAVFALVAWVVRRKVSPSTPEPPLTKETVQ